MTTPRAWTWGLVGVLALTSVALTGCGHKKRSSLMMERRARGPFALERQFGTRQVVYLHPPERTIKYDGIEVTVRFASLKDLQKYFQNHEIFGQDAGLNPYQPENVVFYVQIANRSDKRLVMDPEQFVLVDDMGVQYAYLSPDYLNSLAEARLGIGEATRMGLSSAPSVYGVDVGGFASGIVPKSQKRQALLKQVSLLRGTLFPGVVYDGYISFIRPHKDAKHLRLLLSNIKTDFDPNDEPKRAFDFPFEFDMTQAVVPVPKEELEPEPVPLAADVTETEAAPTPPPPLPEPTPTPPQDSPKTKKKK